MQFSESRNITEDSTVVASLPSWLYHRSSSRGDLKALRWSRECNNVKRQPANKHCQQSHATFHLACLYYALCIKKAFTGDYKGVMWVLRVEEWSKVKLVDKSSKVSHARLQGECFFVFMRRGVTALRFVPGLRQGIARPSVLACCSGFMHRKSSSQLWI